MGRMARSMKLKIGALSAGLLGALALSGAVAAQPAAKAVTVHIISADYGTLPTDLKVGDTITWINDDTVAHTVTARDHSFDLHLNPGQSAKLTLKKGGAMQIYCLFHSSMRGTLTASSR
jgi:plastocyanin